MVCPFLSEVQVRYCRLAPMRKLIPLSAAMTGERCSHAQFAECPTYRTTMTESSSEASVQPGCPCLEDSLMQYCGAAPVPRMVPWSEAAVSRCGNGGYRYCDLFLDMAGAPWQHLAAGPDTLPVPTNLRYAPNHMWLDDSAEMCHVGIDAFLARVLGNVERVDFVTSSGRHHPAAVITAAGVEWTVAFPARMTLAGTNRALRTEPERVASDPYGRGWLFEGTNVEPGPALMNATDAARWIEDEMKRLNEFIQERTGVAADGGVFEAGLIGQLGRQDAWLLFNDFFSAAAGAAATAAMTTTRTINS
jgi:glycine cleavage system H protein